MTSWWRIQGKCKEDQYSEAIALVKERDNGGKRGNIRDKEKCVNSNDMLHIKPVRYADELNREK